MKARSVIWTALLLAILWPARGSANRKPETPEEQQAASGELSRFADAYAMDYWEAEKHDGKWEVQFIRLEGKSGRLVWEEIGYSHLMDAVDPIESDVKTYPDGHSGRSSE
ncbi:MAG: hypothetical protein JWQ87_2030 [Candidatus Sulfotelmatobacter sp.]|nr:hypothetical protein [Candidatus Sulfotelmatobacter sp.]